jgi:hypothetical protein
MPRRARVRGGGAAGLALLAAALAPVAAAAWQDPGPPRPRVLVIGLDGTRADLLHAAMFERGIAPALRRLAERGVHAPCPRPGAPGCARAYPGPREDPAYRWVTGPGWASVLSGVSAVRLGVTENGHARLRPFAESARRHPSFLERAQEAGLVTAAGGVGAFLTSRDGDGSYPGVLDYECGANEAGPAIRPEGRWSCNLTHRLALESRDPGRDEKLADFLLGQLRDPALSVAMGVFDEVDEAGHRHGFAANRAYLSAIAEADALLAPLLAEVERGAGERGERWLVLVTADHGGHRRWLRGGEHGARAGEDDAIPFLLALYGDATPLAPLRPPVTQMDAHATVLRWLGLPLAPDLDGRAQGFE